MANKRSTRQKKIIEEEVNKFDTLFTAEELLERVNKTDRKVGKATIYRFLKELSEQRKLHSYSCNRRTIYSREENNHCHFICQKCGKVVHFDVDNVDFLKKKLKGDICHFQIDVSGICEKCIKAAS